MEYTCNSISGSCLNGHQIALLPASRLLLEKSIDDMYVCCQELYILFRQILKAVSVLLVLRLFVFQPADKYSFLNPDAFLKDEIPDQSVRSKTIGNEC